MALINNGVNREKLGKLGSRPLNILIKENKWLIIY